MVSINIHAIHGDDRVSQAPNISIQQASYPIDKVIQRFPHFTDIKLKQLLNHPVIQVSFSSVFDHALLLDAQSGEVMPMLTPMQIKQIAQNRSTASAPIKKLMLLSELPDYVPSRNAPTYELSFDTWDNLRFYIDAYTGDIVSKRHSLWHIFDWMWRLHIMDYDDGENIHNYLLQIMALIGLVSVSLGIFLLWSRRRFTKQKMFSKKPYFKHVLLLHKWVALLVFVQLFIWLGSGLYLSFIDKPKTLSLPILRVDWQQAIEPNTRFSDLLTNSGSVVEAKLQDVFGQAHVLVTKERGYHRNFASIKQLLALSSGTPITLERQHLEQYFSEIKIPTSTIRLISETQSEIRGEDNSLWQVVDKENASTYYFDSQSGQNIAIINFPLRVHDFMLRLHFMDYFSQGHFNHIWNIILSMALIILSGSGLVFYWRRLVK